MRRALVVAVLITAVWLYPTWWGFAWWVGLVSTPPPMPHWWPGY